MDSHTAELFKAYEYGVNCGLYLAEMERISEGLFDATLNSVYARRVCLPMKPARRREQRSEKWLEIHGAGQMQFVELVARANTPRIYEQIQL